MPVKYFYYLFFGIMLMLSGFMIYAPDPFGAEPNELMEAYLNGKFPSRAPAGDAEWGIENAFPNLKFLEPTDIVEIPGADKLLISGKNGQVWMI